jgi:hypothetical protein
MNLDKDTMQQEMASRGTGRYQKRDAIVNPNLAVDEDDDGDDSIPGFDELEMTFGGGPVNPAPPIHTYAEPAAPQYDQAPRHEKDVERLPGLWQSTINSWKKQFNEVFHAEVKGQDFIFRSLQRYEYKQILATPNTDPLIREEMICEYCVLYPAQYDFSMMSGEKAGYPAVLSEMIMDNSGFTRDVKVSKL